MTEAGQSVKCGRPDLNRRPSDLQSDTLPAELLPQGNRDALAVRLQLFGVNARKCSASLDTGEHGCLNGMQLGISLLCQGNQFIQFRA